MGLVGLAYWTLGFVLAALAIWVPKRLRVKLPLAAIVVLGFVAPVAIRVAAIRDEADLARSRLQAAMALFDERCKSAGERFFRVVKDVDGFVWMRPRDSSPDLDAQFELDDPYGFDCIGQECIERFLRVIEGANLNPEAARRQSGGYAFVEAASSSGHRYRYTGYIKPWTAQQVAEHKRATGQEPPITSNRVASRREPISEFRGRFGVLWEDISLREDREHWIAGGAVRVIDLQTNEVIAERTGYMIDRAQGNRNGFRSPWSWARANGPRCPEFVMPTTELVNRSLIPRSGE